MTGASPATMHRSDVLVRSHQRARPEERAQADRVEERHSAGGRPRILRGLRVERVLHLMLEASRAVDVKDAIPVARMLHRPLPIRLRRVVAPCLHSSPGGIWNGRNWARTSDPQLVELVLSQLSYAPAAPV